MIEPQGQWLKLCDISISDETIKNLVAEEGMEVIKQKEEERKKVWERGEHIIG